MSVPTSVARPNPVSGLSPHVAAHGQHQASTTAQLVPIIVLIVAVMLPPEIRITIADQTLYAFRIVWIAFTPWIIYRVSRGELEFRLPDMVLIAGACWMVLSFLIIYNVAFALTSGLAVALDVIMPYIITRLCIKDIRDLRRALVILAPAISVVAAFVIFESVTHTQFLREGAQAIFAPLGTKEYGESPLPTIQNDTRFGLLRAMGPFSHPILAGLFLLSFFSLVLFSRLRGWPFWTAFAAGTGVIFTLSSAAYLGLAMVVGLAALERLRQISPLMTWPRFLSICGTFLFAIQMVSEGGLIRVLIRFTLDPQTGYYRLMIWEHGGRSVERYPWFGIGFQEFERLSWMSGSVDAFWLILAMRYGLPCALLLGLAAVLAIVGLARAAARERAPDSETLIGVCITIAVISLLAFTVAFFGSFFVWYFMLIAIGVALSARPRPRLRAVSWQMQVRSRE